jgi:hypothetical protein
MAVDKICKFALMFSISCGHMNDAEGQIRFDGIIKIFKNIPLTLKKKYNITSVYYSEQNRYSKSKIDENSFLTPEYPCFWHSSGGLGTVSKNLAVGLAMVVLSFVFGIWTKGRQHFDDAGFTFNR